MKFTVIKTVIVTTKELYEIKIGGHLDPLSYIGDREPESTVTEREVKVDIFKEKSNE